METLDEQAEKITSLETEIFNISKHKAKLLTEFLTERDALIKKKHAQQMTNLFQKIIDNLTDKVDHCAASGAYKEGYITATKDLMMAMELSEFNF